MAGRINILKKIIQRNGAIEDLTLSLRQRFGNKSYIGELENIFKKLDMSPREEQAIYHLVQDLRNL